MNDMSREKLSEAIKLKGQAVKDDPRLCEALLTDLCGGGSKRHIKALSAAVAAKVVADLGNTSSVLPIEARITQYARRLYDDFGFDEELARWAVESWALALGVWKETVPITPTRKVATPPQPEQKSKPQTIVSMSTNDLLTIAPGVTINLIRIPAGQFVMGSASSSHENEKPQHKVTLDEYWLGKYPVTNAEYAVCAQAKGLNWTMPRGKENHPVVEVNWDDAVAFCAWATQLTGRQVGLPTEAQWEKAARGADERMYPWGNEAPDKTRCNFNREVGDTTPVGKYSPKGDSPYGAVDMAGNVWEWVADWYDESYYAKSPASNPQGTASGQYRVVRSGSWLNTSNVARAAVRNWLGPTNRYVSVGCRVVVASAPVS